MESFPEPGICQFRGTGWPISKPQGIFLSPLSQCWPALLSQPASLAEPLPQPLDQMPLIQVLNSPEMDLKTETVLEEHCPFLS